MKKHIAIFSEDYPPYTGGIAQWAYGVACGLLKSGWQVDVHYRFRAGINPLPLPQPGKLYPIYGNNWSQLRTWIIRKHTRKYLQDHTPKIIIGTTWNTTRGIIPVVSKSDVPVITLVHGLEITRIKSLLKRLWLKKTLQASALIIAVSHATKERLIKTVPIAPEHVNVIFNGVDPDRFYPDMGSGQRFRKKFGIPEEAPVILTLARIVERKGHDTVLNALPKIINHFPGLFYIIAGPGEDHTFYKLQKIIRKLGISANIIFTGSVEQDELCAVYNACDVYVMISRDLPSKGDMEGFGITYLEANACGKPVIAGDSGGVKDAVENELNGLLIPPDNPEILSERIIFLLKNTEILKKLGEAGRTRVLEKFTWNKIAQQIVQRFQVLS
jgi:phosphatidylinositol alpha-1,6-mannosyltransferase